MSTQESAAPLRKLFGARKDINLLPDIVDILADAHCTRAARLAIREMPVDSVVSSLLTAIGHSDNKQVRRGAIRMLREYPDAVHEEEVCAHVTDQDLYTYSEVADLLRAVISLRPLQPNVSNRLQQDYLAIRTRAYLFDAVRLKLKPDVDALLFCDQLNRQYTSAVDTTLRLVAVEHPAFPVDACLEAVNSGDPAMMPYVLELMETTLAGQQRRFLAPLVEESQWNVRESIFLGLFKNPESVIPAYINDAAVAFIERSMGGSRRSTLPLLQEGRFRDRCGGGSWYYESTKGVGDVFEPRKNYHSQIFRSSGGCRLRALRRSCPASPQRYAS